MKRTITIVQARMGSTRLPGKALADIGGATMLARVVNRARRARGATALVVATTLRRADDLIVAEAERLAVSVSRGDEDDVLDRYYQAAREHAADVVVRITSDCPLIDPAVIDLVIAERADRELDYCSNALERTFPRGLDCEALTFEALEKVWTQACEPYERTHVTAYLYGHPNEFRIGNVRGDEDASEYRWTVDTAEDLALARALYERLGNTDTFGWREALAVMRADPQLAELNRGVMQKQLHER